jgi:hypothetical protein
VVDEPVRQRHRPELQPTIQQPIQRQELHHMRRKAANAAFLNANQRSVLARAAADQVCVQRLAEASIHDSR